MNPTWRSFLETAAGVFDTESSPILLSFGDAVGELQAADGQTILVPLTHLGQLDVSGEDAKSFLHSQFTSDINHLGAGQVQHSGWCTAKGRMQASFLAWRDGERYQLAISADLQEAAQKRLQMFILRSKVKLASLTDSTILLGLAGPLAAELLADAALPCPDAAMTSLQTDGVTVIRLDTQRFLVAAPDSAAAALWAKLSAKARPAGIPAWRWLDIQAGYPLVTLATKEEFVPQMADFEKIGGVSFHKGCYPGQEIVARTQYLGKVKRHLYRLSSPVALSAGDVLHSPDNPDQSCGMVMTAAPSPTGGYEGLGVVQSNYAGNVRLGALTGPEVKAVAVNP
ncbi:folate-binding protein [Dechloromonas sp. TW-R-39-2]|uniref:CAF17-like 4Fe-4S cluster assembly/insertion protein YgfZ n=1 Tax=Dechloromonas sp. TW-R-39-2 TaxID=2654218 RepID=UPI00193CA7C8|nr:folate-binding protein YgfZ [Dechloromonas sp. TW-R-39-2]QRM19817.1 folate-binding protein [Dechloromonas sp. TW-R-39-2]